MPKQVWEAEDGTQFEDEEECKQYEYYLKEITKQLKDTGGFENAVKLVGNWYYRINLFTNCDSFDPFDNHEYLAGEHEDQLGLGHGAKELAKDFES